MHLNKLIPGKFLHRCFPLPCRLWRLQRLFSADDGRNKNVMPRISFGKLVFLFMLYMIPLIYLTFCPGLHSDLYYPMLFPSERQAPRLPPKLRSVCRDVFFPAGNHLLHGWFLKHQGARSTVVFHHGNEGNIENWLPFMENMYDRGFSVLMYDYEGYGRSEGTPSMNGILKDGEAAYDFLISSGRARPEEVINLGTSLGSAVATHVAANRQSKALILWSPYSSLLRTCKDNCPFLQIYPDLFFPEKDIGCGYEISKIVVPVLILHGDNDKCIDVEQACELQHARPSTKLIELTGAGHVQERWFQRSDFQGAMNDFMKQIDSSPAHLDHLDHLG